MSSPRVLLISDDVARDLIPLHELESCELIRKPFSSEVIEGPVGENIGLVIFGQPQPDMPLEEVSQSLRMHYPQAAIYAVSVDRKLFNRALAKKNGVSDAFLLPTDHSVFVSTIKADISKLSDGQLKAYRQVKLIDITPDSVLGFDLYLHLPANNRRIRFVSKSESLGPDRMARLQKHQVQSASVSEDQMQQFYDFTARQLNDLASDKKMSETEKQERRERAVRDLLSGMLSESNSEDSIEHGRQIMGECQEIIKSFMGFSKEGSWAAKFLNVVNTEKTPYSHASNTATFATLLSIAFGIGDPKEMAVAGLLHDIGMSDLPPEIVAKSASERTPAEEAEYRRHPLLSIQIIKQRRMIVSDLVLKVIEQHHERYNGTGYPAAIPGPRVCKEAQLLAIADEIDELTTVRPNMPVLSIPDAVRKICEDNLSNPSGAAFSPELMHSLQKLFFPPDKNEAA